jgi:hypothetical protein
MDTHILQHMFMMFSGCELARAGAVCKLWHATSSDDSLWKYLFAEYVGMIDFITLFSHTTLQRKITF